MFPCTWWTQSVDRPGRCLPFWLPPFGWGTCRQSGWHAVYVSEFAMGLVTDESGRLLCSKVDLPFSRVAIPFLMVVLGEYAGVLLYCSLKMGTRTICCCLMSLRPPRRDRRLWQLEGMNRRICAAMKSCNCRTMSMIYASWILCKVGTIDSSRWIAMSQSWARKERRDPGHFDSKGGRVGAGFSRIRDSICKLKPRYGNANLKSPMLHEQTESGVGK